MNDKVKKTGGGRALKKQLKKLLLSDDFNGAVKEIMQFPARQVVNPLFSFFYTGEEILKWRAVSTMGTVVADLAEQDIESARVVMRRLMWNLNEESGGIGWGSPEAMGEIMAQSEKLADEFSCILISYICEERNFLEHEILQRGVLWGIGRFAHARPRYFSDFPHQMLLPFIESEDATHRGLASWIAGALGNDDTKPLLKRLVDDNAMLSIYRNGRLEECTVALLAEEALEREKKKQWS